MTPRQRPSFYGPEKLTLLASWGKSFVRDPDGIGIGSVVELNSGSPRALVVDLLAGNLVMISWKGRDGRVIEYAIHRRCIHRVKDTHGR